MLFTECNNDVPEEEEEVVVVDEEGLIDWDEEEARLMEVEEGSVEGSLLRRIGVGLDAVLVLVLVGCICSLCL